MNVIFKSKYMTAEAIKSDGVTSVFAIRSIKGQAPLGQIKWYAPWRQYCFFSNPIFETVLSKRCLQDITAFIQTLMKRWRDSR